MNINATLLGQSIAFFLFVVFCMKYVWPPIMKALHDRQKRIAEGLAAADRGKHEQVLAKERAKEVLHEAKAQAAEILSQAQARAAEIVDDAKGDARVEGQRLVTAARAEIEQETNRAREHLREQVAALALAGAEKVLGREINAAAHKDVLESIAKQI